MNDITHLQGEQDLAAAPHTSARARTHRALRKSLRRFVAPVAFGVAALLVGAPVAASADDVNPLWYFDQMGVQAVHDAGITGEGVTIAVLDGKFNPDLITFDGADIELRPLEGCELESTDKLDAGHGSAVTSLLVGNGTSSSGDGVKGIAPDVRVLYYNELDDECHDHLSFEVTLRDSIDQGADIVSISGGFGAATKEGRRAQRELISEALRAGVIFVTGLPNAWDASGSIFDTTNGVVSVAAVDPNGEVQPNNLKDGPLLNEDVDVAAPGLDVAGVMEAASADGWGYAYWSGNSAATPLVSGALALAKQKWPDATPSQLIQSLIRNAGDDADELAWNDAVGYGVIDLPAMIATDPSQYPDENPLFRDDRELAYDEVFGEPEPEPEPSSEPAASGASSEMWMLGGVLAVLGLGALLVLALVVLVIVAVVRRRRRRTGDGA